MYICTHYKSIKVTLTQVATGRNGNIKGELHQLQVDFKGADTVALRR